MSVCVDLGSRNCVVVAGRQARIYPSALAVEEYTGRILAFGQEALELEGRCPPRTSVVHPISRGLVSDMEGARQLVRLVLNDAVGWRRWAPGALRLATSTSLGRLERSVLTEAVRAGGGGNPALRWRALGAALAEGLEPDEAPATAVIDLGAETTEMALFAGGRLYRSKSLARGGQDLTAAILRGFSEERHVELGLHTAEALKCSLGSAHPGDTAALTQEVQGRGRASGLPEQVTVSRADLRAWFEPELHQLESAARQMFSQLDPEVASDLVRRGLLLAGGGARLHGMAEFLGTVLGLRVRLASDPQTCGARGALLLQPAGGLGVAV